MENIQDNLEEIEEEYLVFRDLSKHPNLPTFVGIFLKHGTQPEDDQLWFVMEVIVVDFLGTFTLTFDIRLDLSRLDESLKKTR